MRRLWSRWLVDLLALAFVVLALPAPAFANAVADTSRQDHAGHLCLRPVLEIPIPSLQPIALSTSEARGMPPTVTVWSYTSLMVIRLSPDEPTIDSTYQASLPTPNPLAAAVVGWEDEGPIVEVLDATTGSVWTVEISGRNTTRAEESARGAPPSGATRMDEGWVRALRTESSVGDSLTIVMAGAGLARNGVAPSAQGNTTTHRRNINDVIHVRPGARSTVLVTEATFPFTLVRFALDGRQIRHASPVPRELRDRLNEGDLRYVIATPGVDVDGAVLNSFVGLRSLRRITALRFSDGTVRYQEIPSDLAFLGSLRRHQLLVATRSGDPHRIALFRWRWTDQRQSCVNPQSGRLS